MIKNECFKFYSANQKKKKDDLRNMWLVPRLFPKTPL